MACAAATAAVLTVAGSPRATAAAAAVCLAGPRAEPDANRPRYTLNARLDLPARRLDGDVTVRFIPDLPIDRLVFRLWPNTPSDAWGAATPLRVTSLRVGERDLPVAAPSPAPSTLVIPLAEPAPAGAAVEAALAFTLRLPGTRNDRISVTGEAARLQTFFPLLAWEPGVGWNATPPTIGHAEAVMSAVADFAVTLTTVPADLDVLATGLSGRQFGGTSGWTAAAVRDLAVSVGRFRTARAAVAVEGRAEPVAVSVGVHRGLVDDPAAYLARVSSALRRFSRSYGPYPYPSLSVAVTPGLRGGIEGPMHVMQGPASIGRTTPHEVAHQWFYALVGNDQGRDPWLDEGLASWAEVRHEGTLAAFASRVLPPDAVGRLGAAMTYWDRHRGSYYRGAYVQGVQALAALGDPARVDCALARYVARFAHRVARPADLASVLTSEFPAAREVLRRYGATDVG